MEDAVKKHAEMASDNYYDFVHPKTISAHGYKHGSPHHYDGYTMNFLMEDDFAYENEAIENEAFEMENGQVEDKLQGGKKSKKSKKKKHEAYLSPAQDPPAPHQRTGFTHAYI